MGWCGTALPSVWQILGAVPAVCVCADAHPDGGG